MRRAKSVLLGSAITLATLAPLAHSLLAQSQPDTSKTLYGVFNMRKLEIPITISQPEKVKEISELLLFVSSDNGKTWQQADFATPRRESFEFVAERDGVYLFNVVTKYRNGTQDPPSLTAAPAKLQLLIDATRPVVTIKSLERSGEDALILWEAQEQHPDVQSLRLQYQPKGGQWIDIPIPPALSGSHRFKVSDSGAVLVRLSMKDAAGNVGSDEKHLAAAANEPFRASVEPNGSATTQAPAWPPTQTHSTVSPPASQATLPLHSPAAPSQTQALPMPPVTNQPAGQASLTQTVATHTLPNPPPLGHAAINHAPLPGRELSHPLPLATPTPASATPTSVPPPPPLPTHTATHAGIGANQPVAVSSPVGPLPPIQVVNTPRIALGYEVSKVGQSGLRSVDLWMTRDDGRTWERFATDPDKQSPIEADLPGEGVYGFRLVLESGVGLSRGAPLPNTPPEIRVELDRTPPTIVMEKPQPEPGRTDTWRITWRAEDRNLASRPISLEYATQEDGPWLALTPEATHLPNSGYFAWMIPANFRPHHIYLRITARDTAGNVGEARWREPLLVDLSRPEGSITGLLRPSSGQANSPSSAPGTPPIVPPPPLTVPAPVQPAPTPTQAAMPAPTQTPMQSSTQGQPSSVSVSPAPIATPTQQLGQGDRMAPPRMTPPAASVPNTPLPAPAASVPLQLD